MSNYTVDLSPPLFTNVAAGQQEVDLEGRTPQEKAELIRSMLDNLNDDHPLVVNIRSM